MATSDLQHAEQGKTLRIPFITLFSGVPATPISPFNVTVHAGQDELAATVATLSPVTDDVGKFHVDWGIPLAQALGYYTAYVNAEVSLAVFFQDRIRFQLYAAGAFVAEQSAPESTRTVFERLSAARNEQNFVLLVRMFLRDHPELNRLTNGWETSDGEIRAAAMMAISMYNNEPPLLADVGFKDFPSIAWLVIGTIGWILMSSTHLRRRNNLQYTDGPVTVDTENLSSYEMATDKYWNMFMNWSKKDKIAQNVRNGYGISPTGLHSEYYLLSAYLGSSVAEGVGAFSLQ